MFIKRLFHQKPRSGLGLRASFLLALSLFCVFMDYRYHSFDTLRMSVAPLVYPLQRLVDAPFHWIEKIRNRQQGFHDLLQAHQSLQDTHRLQNARLQTLEALEAENAHLRALLKVKPQAAQTFLMAEIVQVHNDPFMQRILLNRGEQDGVVLGQPLINAEGILGEIIEVFPKTSRAILLSDVSYGISVENLRSGVRGIVRGRGLNQALRLQHVPNTIDLEVGDLLVSSGLEGRYPSGYPVGHVTEMKQTAGESFAEVKVQVSASHQKSRQVLLIQSSKD